MDGTRAVALPLWLPLIVTASRPSKPSFSLEQTSICVTTCWIIPFYMRAQRGLLDILKLTIAAGADPKLTNRYGGTALIPAAQRGHVEVVREILMHTKVDINHINKLGWTALLEAIVLTDGGVKHQQIVQLLVDHGADVIDPG